MLVFIGSLLVQVLLIIHCVQSGRNPLWIWVLALLSFAGAIAYVAVEIVPELLDRMSLAPPHVRKARQAWLAAAERG
jgi:hypothetical protein